MNFIKRGFISYSMYHYFKDCEMYVLWTSPHRHHILWLDQWCLHVIDFHMSLFNHILFPIGSFYNKSLPMHRRRKLYSAWAGAERVSDHRPREGGQGGVSLSPLGNFWSFSSLEIFEYLRVFRINLVRCIVPVLRKITEIAFLSQRVQKEVIVIVFKKCKKVGRKNIPPHISDLEALKPQTPLPVLMFTMVKLNFPP